MERFPILCLSCSSMLQLRSNEPAVLKPHAAASAPQAVAGGVRIRPQLSAGLGVLAATLARRPASAGGSRRGVSRARCICTRFQSQTERTAVCGTVTGLSPATQPEGLSRDLLRCHQQSRRGWTGGGGGQHSGVLLGDRSLIGDMCWPGLPLWWHLSNIWLIVLYF